MSHLTKDGILMVYRVALSKYPVLRGYQVKCEGSLNGVTEAIVEDKLVKRVSLSLALTTSLDDLISRDGRVEIASMNQFTVYISNGFDKA